jgi:WD40 repeat protein
MDRLRIEGFSKVQHAGVLRVGQQVLVEPELHGAQLAQLVGHTAPVNQLAISQDGKFLASASDDGTVAVWSWPGAARVALLQHPGAVHAVDLMLLKTGAEPVYVLATGGEDRIVRIWRLSPKGRIGEPVLLQGHDGIIRTVAISSDGARCASGGEDRRIGLWDLAQKKHGAWISTVGAFQKSAHQGVLTALQFAGQDTLVSTGTDNVHKVWDLKDGKNQLLKVHKGRSGDVSRPGYGHVDRRLFLDHGDEMWLIDRDSGAVQGVLHNSRHVRFEGFASFSASNRLIVTASANGLQLWRAPVSAIARAAQRANPASLPDLGGFEVRQYHLPKATQARCGVVAPDESVFFTGGTGRAIQAWAIPAADEWKQREARLTFVGSEVEPGTELVRIQAEMDNPPERSRWWLPGTFARLKVFP